MRAWPVVTSALMIVAAINETLGYVLYTVDNPGASFQTFVPIALIGAVPFVVTAIVIILVRASVSQIRMASGLGLVPIAVGGFWSGLGLAFLGIEPNTPEAVAIFLYQFTLVAAILADVVLLILALRAKP